MPPWPDANAAIVAKMPQPMSAVVADLLGREGGGERGVPSCVLEHRERAALHGDANVRVCASKTGTVQQTMVPHLYHSSLGCKLPSHHATCEARA